MIKTLVKYVENSKYLLTKKILKYYTIAAQDEIKLRIERLKQSLKMSFFANERPDSKP